MFEADGNILKESAQMQTVKNSSLLNENHDEEVIPTKVRALNITVLTNNLNYLSKILQ